MAYSTFLSSGLNDVFILTDYETRQHPLMDITSRLVEFGPDQATGRL